MYIYTINTKYFLRVYPFLFDLRIRGQGYEFITMKSLCVSAGVTKPFQERSYQTPLSVPNSVAEVHLKHGSLVHLKGRRVYKSLISIFNSRYLPHP